MQMHVDSLTNAPKTTDEELLDFFALATQERTAAPQRSVAIARFVFNVTDPYLLGFTPAPFVLRIRDEFGALEAPGQPDNDDLDLAAYENGLWERLGLLIEERRSSLRDNHG